MLITPDQPPFFSCILVIFGDLQQLMPRHRGENDKWGSVCGGQSRDDNDTIGDMFSDCLIMLPAHWWSVDYLTIWYNILILQNKKTSSA